jgi:glutamyl-tRNA synthetase
MEKEGAAAALEAAGRALNGVTAWDTENIEVALRAMLAEEELSARKGLQPIRVAVSGSTVSPPLFESLDVLGRDRSLARIAAARTRLG